MRMWYAPQSLCIEWKRYIWGGGGNEFSGNVADDPGAIDSSASVVSLLFSSRSRGRMHVSDLWRIRAPGFCSRSMTFILMRFLCRRHGHILSIKWTRIEITAFHALWSVANFYSCKVRFPIKIRIARHDKHINNALLASGHYSSVFFQRVLFGQRSKVVTAIDSTRIGQAYGKTTHNLSPYSAGIVILRDYVIGYCCLP